MLVDGPKSHCVGAKQLIWCHSSSHSLFFITVIQMLTEGREGCQLGLLPVAWVWVNLESFRSGFESHVSNLDLVI